MGFRTSDMSFLVRVERKDLSCFSRSILVRKVKKKKNQVCNYSRNRLRIPNQNLKRMRMIEKKKNLPYSKWL